MEINLPVPPSSADDPANISQPPLSVVPTGDNTVRKKPGKFLLKILAPLMVLVLLLAWYLAINVYKGRQVKKQILDQLALPSPAPSATTQVEEFCQKESSDSKMSYQEAKEIASQSGCIKEGQLKENHFCNSNTGTWWIDLENPKGGCNPACVVNITTKQAEINWRCTGLTVSPQPSPLTIINILNTEDWKAVSVGGISFKIPKEAKCNDDKNCSLVSYEWEINGNKGTSNIPINVVDYGGGNKKELYLVANNEVLGCNPVYEEAQFGSLTALQVAVDSSVCQGGSGGIAVVVNNKFVTIAGGLNYNSANKIINRWPIRDTLVATLH